MLTCYVDENALCDFLIYRAENLSLNKKWQWVIGDEPPLGQSRAQILPALPNAVTEVPHDFRCPISQDLMEDAVTASDGFTYSRDAISKWFAIRNSSPMHGLQLNSTALTPEMTRSDAVGRWISGEGLTQQPPPPARTTRSRQSQGSPSANASAISLTFVSRVGSFQRCVAPDLSMVDLYRLVFRGLRAKFLVMQLAYNDITLPANAATISSRFIADGARIDVRLADESDLMNTSAGQARAPASGDFCLVKIFDTIDHMLTAFWVKRDTPQTLATVLWKYWRREFNVRRLPKLSSKSPWTDLNSSGDGLLTGQPRQTTDQLATYLNALHCFGTLGAEKVYREDDYVRSAHQPLVLKVKIERAHRPKVENSRLTRLDVLKQMFEALINRMLAYNYKTHIGLLAVGSKPSLTTPITHVLENFRHGVAGMSADGDTALWDALALAKDQLTDYARKYPSAKKRIIVISDGEDTASKNNKPEDLCWELRNAGIAADSISLGHENNINLQTLSHLLGCYKFHPTSLVNALAICEMEPFLSLTERPDIVAAPGTPHHRLNLRVHFMLSRALVEPTMVTSDDMPPRKEHPNLRDSFIQLTAFAHSQGATNNVENRSSRQNLRTSRLMNEMRQIVAGAHPKYDIYVSEVCTIFLTAKRMC